MEQLKEWLQFNRNKVIVIGISILFMILFLIIGIWYFSQKEVDEEKVVEEKLVIKDDSNVEKEKTSLVTVDIKGAIINPGIYSVSDSFRVMDVIVMAGGLRDDANTSVINLGKRVFDEMVVIIYTKDEVNNFTKVKEQEVIKQEKCVSEDKYEKNDGCFQVDNGSKSNDSNSIKELVSLNSATLEQLMTLSGIGEAKAKIIIDYRTEEGPFEKIEDLMNVKGIGESVFEKVKAYITV